MKLRVVKVGGSLLDWPSLPRALDDWLKQQPAAWNVLIAGGGEFAESIRRADKAFGLSEETAHWLCVDVLSVTARLLASLAQPPTTIAASLEQLQNQMAAAAAGTIVLDPRDWLVRDEPHLPGRPLPHTWDVTTDSIAARLAEVLTADELVLLKSADPPVGATLGDLAAGGLVDACFPQATAFLRGSVRLVNLRTFRV